MVSGFLLSCRQRLAACDPVRRLTIRSTNETEQAICLDDSRGLLSRSNSLVTSPSSSRLNPAAFTAHGPHDSCWSDQPSESPQRTSTPYGSVLRWPLPNAAASFVHLIVYAARSHAFCAALAAGVTARSASARNRKVSRCAFTRSRDPWTLLGMSL